MNKDWFPSMRLNDLQSVAIKWERISNVYKFAHNINYLWLWVAGSTIVCDEKNLGRECDSYADWFLHAYEQKDSVLNTVVWHDW